MICTQDSSALIRAGLQTLMHRPWKDGDELFSYCCLQPNVISDAWVMRKGRLLWKMGHTYAIQPGCGKKAVGRIRITGIRLQTLGDITDHDALLEGVTHHQYIPMEWAYGCTNFEAPTRHEAYFHLWQSIYGHAEATEKCWAVSFEVCK